MELLYWVIIDIVISVVTMIFILKSLNEENAFSSKSRTKRIIIRFVLLILSPIIVPIFSIVSIFYVLFGWLINILFE